MKKLITQKRLWLIFVCFSALVLSPLVSAQTNPPKNAQIKTEKTPQKKSKFKATKTTELLNGKKVQIKARKSDIPKKNSQIIGTKTQTKTQGIVDSNTQQSEIKVVKKSSSKTESISPPPNKQKKVLRKSQRVRARGLGRLNERDSAFAPRAGSWSVGIFNPLKIQINDNIGIETHPVVALLVAPHLKVWQNLWSKKVLRLQGLYGFSTPTWSLQRNVPFGLAGYLSPSCQVSETEAQRAPQSCQRPGFDFVPQLGARLSGEQYEGIWSLEVDVAFGLMITENRPAPLDSYAPVEMAYAPSTQNYRAHLGLKYSHMIHSSFALNLAADLYITGQADSALMPEKEPLSFSSQLNFDWALSRHTSLTMGVIAWVSDQRAFDLVEDDQGFVKKEPVMSLDIFPTLDFMWHY